MEENNRGLSLSELAVHHTGYIVKNLEEALTRVEKMYGLKADAPYYFRPDRAWVNGAEVNDYCLKIAMIPTGGPEILEMIEPVNGNGIHKQFLEATGGGIHHLCFSVNNYDAWHEFFSGTDAKIIFEAEVEDERFGYRRCFYAEDVQTGMVYEIKEEPYFRT